MVRTGLCRAALAVIATAALSLVACGGGPSAADGAGVTVRGTLQGGVQSLGVRAASAGAATGATVTVSVLENPVLTTTVGADGSFTLRGLPEGGFTLVFSSGGTEIGRLTFAEVKPNQEITLSVQVTSGGVVLLEEQRNGIGHGDVEIEGNVTQVLVLSATGDSRFLVNGRTVVARPGQTSVREGNRVRHIEDVTEGRHVHVRGSWLPMEGTVQPVLASEILLQGDETNDDGGGLGASGCPTGANTQVEGIITDRTSSAVVVNQQGKGLFSCQVNAGTRIRKGNTTYTLAQLQTGWRVHVSGTGLGSVAGTCAVAADEVKVQ